MSNIKTRDYINKSLDEMTAEEILRTNAGALGPGDLKRIRNEALGNPLALIELPRAWGERPPTDVHPPALSARLEQAFIDKARAPPRPKPDDWQRSDAGITRKAREVGVRARPGESYDAPLPLMKRSQSNTPSSALAKCGSRQRV